MMDGALCLQTKLCEAHIVPKAFARDVRGDHQMMSITSDSGIRTAKTPDGVFDKHILCAACDRALGIYDQYGVEFCRAFEVSAVRKNGGWEVDDVDSDRLLKFYLSVLWRSSISSRPECLAVKLGPYENAARDVLFGERPLSSLYPFEISLTRIKTTIARIDGLFDFPARLQNPWGFNGYAFLLGGFYTIAKVDRRPLTGALKHFTITGPSVCGTFQRFEHTPQYRAMAPLILKRAKSPQRKRHE